MGGLNLSFLNGSAPTRAELLARINEKATDEELDTIARLLDKPTLRAMALNKARKLL